MTNKLLLHTQLRISKGIMNRSSSQSLTASRIELLTRCESQALDWNLLSVEGVDSNTYGSAQSFTMAVPKHALEADQSAAQEQSEIPQGFIEASCSDRS